MHKITIGHHLTAVAQWVSGVTNLPLECRLKASKSAENMYLIFITLLYLSIQVCYSKNALGGRQPMQDPKP